MMKLVFVSVFSYFLLNYSVTAEDDSKCAAPNGEMGTCLSINDCPTIYDAALRARTMRQKEFLKSLNCGWISDIPKVCCNGNRLLATFGNPNIDSRSPDPHRTKCGFQDTDKILGGTSTLITEFPWTALLVYAGTPSFKCGGALINNRYVLSAAHCEKRNPSHVRLGEWDLRNPVDCIGNGSAALCSQYVEIEIEFFKSHENYQYNTISGLLNDIALIRLKKEISYTAFIQPICLPKTEKSDVGAKLWVTGWGVTNPDISRNSDVKQKVQMRIISLSDCRSIYKNNNFKVQITDSQICAVGEETNQSSCIGDSGNPFMTTLQDNELQFYVEGIVSYSDVHCTTKVPVVFTRVSHFTDWIENNIRP